MFLRWGHLPDGLGMELRERKSAPWPPSGDNKGRECGDSRPAQSPALSTQCHTRQNSMLLQAHVCHRQMQSHVCAMQCKATDPAGNCTDGRQSMWWSQLISSFVTSDF